MNQTFQTPKAAHRQGIFRHFIPFFFLLAATILLLSACAAQPQDDGRLRVVATVFPPYDFTREIAGENVQLTLLLPPGTESHSYEPTPQDIITIQECDLFIYTGGESDSWIDTILDSLEPSQRETIRMMECVGLLEEEIVEGMEAPHSHSGESADEEETEYDEHVWTSPRNAISIVSAIENALCRLDPANADSYHSNASSYCEELSQLDAQFREIVSTAQRRVIVFGDRFPFRYFAEEYGLSYYAAFPGCAAESEPSAATVAFLIDKVREENIPAVFYLELSNQEMCDTICEETGARKLLFHSCHNLSAQELEAGEGYLSLMQGNAQRLKEALN